MDKTLHEKLLDAEMKFVGYYKYYFSFEGEKDGWRLLGSIGGNKDDIYKIRVNPLMLAGDMWDLRAEKEGKKIQLEENW